MSYSTALRWREAINSPIVPTVPRTRIIQPAGMGIPRVFTGLSSEPGVAKEGAGVNVGNLVAVGSIWNCAANVGSRVGEAGGTGVGGGSTMGNDPGETVTRAT